MTKQGTKTKDFSAQKLLNQRVLIVNSSQVCACRVCHALKYTLKINFDNYNYVLYV